ncbi:gluconate 2-dehydrogenase subunit 3 family protein [Acidiphilium sp. AL]|uniref:Gluconate 2-dehydrogenase subunit 3 family protein n=1 Tax=Acidiphilium iwatense TaxID=768198 RepID=A0ABS9DY53_9PROT|nr:MULTISPECIES: gluconate 2-dehydrogenase subunit 3 family protein [Acidiphilium]MCF3947604.1 gluconate 2-dehydrogenase subunit 3 family protein [Acidiphilium iwatense]MCU4160770.1 gluconate 2-dehydrogenase subunit 3 family protein [Acidiphilium sp. AL]
MLDKRFTRRVFLVSSTSCAALLGSLTRASADTYHGALPWSPDQDHAPVPVSESGWTYFTPAEAATIEALVDRLIPADDLSPGGKEVGIAVYIDRQLSGAFGQDKGLYMAPPFAEGLPGQGSQSPITPAQRYRKTIDALNEYCADAYFGKSFAQLAATEQDKIIVKMESGMLRLKGLSSKAFFQILWQNTKEGFFADPVYGGNRGMAGWKMIGFPGARYDYLDWVDRHNEHYPKPPIGIESHPDWSAHS